MGTVPTSQITQKTISSSSDFDYFPAQDCSELVVLNNTGQDIYVRQDDNGKEGIPYLCKDNTFYVVEGILNANQVWIKLATGSTPATVQARFFN